MKSFVLFIFSVTAFCALGTPSFAGISREKAQKLVCESGLASRDPLEFLAKESSKYPIPTEEQILAEHNALSNFERAIWDILKKSPWFKPEKLKSIQEPLEIDLDAFISESTVSHSDFLKVFTEMQKTLPKESLAGYERLMIESALQTQQKYFNWLTTGNIKLLLHFAGRLSNNQLDVGDRIQEGFWGLQLAAEGFRPELGYAFSTYASIWVKNKILRGRDNLERTIRIPVNKMIEMRHYRETRRKLNLELSREPNIEEMAQNMEMSVEKARELESLYQETFIGLDDAYRISGAEKSDSASDSTSKVANYVEDPTAVKKFDEVVEQIQMEKLVSTLPEREQKVVRDYFGLNASRDSMTFLEISGQMGVTKQRVQQIFNIGMAKLQAKMGVPLEQRRDRKLKDNIVRNREQYREKRKVLRVQRKHKESSK